MTPTGRPRRRQADLAFAQPVQHPGIIFLEPRRKFGLAVLGPSCKRARERKPYLMQDTWICVAADVDDGELVPRSFAKDSDQCAGYPCRTLGNLGNPRGRDKEGVAQSEGEPTLPSQAPSTLSLPSTVALNSAPRCSSAKKRPLSSLADSCAPVKFQFALQRQPPSTSQ